jgi:hypothetical protein
LKNPWAPHAPWDFSFSAPFPWRTKPARHEKSSMAHPYRGPGRLQSSRSALPHGYELTIRAEEQRKASYTLTVRVSDRFPFSPGGCYEIISKFDLGAVSLPGGQIARLTAGRPRLAAAQALGAAPGRPGREDREGALEATRVMREQQKPRSNQVRRRRSIRSRILR